MYFKRLEMHGFKSFAEPVVIEFHEGVTCIVGPNGSGKSNISDAIRWVLGEQSPKALRGGKMEEVIFAGTASRKSRGMAEVTLVIDNSAGILDIDYNEVAITRRMYRSGESEYLINNNQCRLRDIRELIMDTGIGVDGYSLIGQGKIADIVSNKPESRREIFEEAAGVVMYKNKKAEAERKLESTGNNLDRVDDIISEIEGRIESLAEDSTKAKEYLALKERYRDLEINITLKNIDNIVERNRVFQDEIKELSAEIEEIAAKKKTVEAEAAESRQKSENLERLGNEARDRLLHIVEEINTLTSRRQLNRERLSGIEKDTERLNSEISDLKERLSAEEENRAQLIKSGEEIGKNYRSASESLRESIRIHGKLTEEAAELSDAADRCREEMFRLHNLAAAKNSEAKSYESIRDTLLKRKQQLLTEAEGAEENREEIRTKLTLAEEDGRKNGILLQQYRKELSDLHKEKEVLTEQKKKLSLKAEEVRLLGGQKVSRKKTIEEMEHNYEGYNYAVKYIMRSGISGICGVVAELMEVPEGFETAVETALGGQMQNIVCDTDESAKEAISLLKKNRAGRLTFLPAASIKGSRAYPDSRITNDSGYRGLAADCITCRNEYRTIFDYLLGRVVIAADMESAIRMSKKSGSGFRFVTLDGEIINISGAITGGKYKNKTANLLERRNEIAALEKEIERLSEEASEIAETGRNIDTRIAENDEKTEKLADSQRQAELAGALSESNLKALRETMERISSSREKFDTELSSIERDSADAETTVAELLAEAEKAKESAKQMESRAEDALAAYEAKKTVLEQASEKITAARIAAAEWESKQSNLESLLARIRNSAEDYAFQIETKENELTNICAEKNEILFGADGTLERTEKLIEMCIRDRDSS